MSYPSRNEMNTIFFVFVFTAVILCFQIAGCKWALYAGTAAGAMMEAVTLAYALALQGRGIGMWGMSWLTAGLILLAGSVLGILRTGSGSSTSEPDEGKD